MKKIQLTLRATFVAALILAVNCDLLPLDPVGPENKGSGTVSAMINNTAWQSDFVECSYDPEITNTLFITAIKTGVDNHNDSIQIVVENVKVGNQADNGSNARIFSPTKNVYNFCFLSGTVNVVTLNQTTSNGTFTMIADALTSNELKGAKITGNFDVSF